MVMSCLMLAIFSLIISVQNFSVKQIVHASSKTTCSCGCQDEGGSCGGDCCSTQSLSSCGCMEPHETVFVIPGHLDSFLQFGELVQNVNTPVREKYRNDINCYESLNWEPPSPIPIA